MTDPNSVLTNKEKNICEYGATFGVLLTLTCLVQHLIVAIPGPITNPMLPMYVFMLLSFLLFGFQKQFSVILLVISGLLCLVIQYIWMTHFAFSLVVMLLFIYHVVIIVVVFMESIPGKLRMKRLAAKAERDLWNGKI